MQRTIAKLAKEPLVQFLLLGTLVFAIDVYVFETADNPRRIEIDDARYEELVEVFEQGQGRRPTEDEIGDLIVKWTQNEILYREALTMGLDRGDEMVRQRMILKIRDILFNNLIIEAPADDVLEAWFEENRSAYDRPELIDFEQFLAAGLNEAGARELAASLGAAERPEEYAQSFRRYPQRIDDNLRSVFDPDHAEVVIAAPIGHWVAAESGYGWHLVRITSRMPGEPAEFAAIRHDVVRDWLDFEKKRQLADSLGDIVDDYDISYEFTREIVEQSIASNDADRQTTAR